MLAAEIRKDSIAADFLVSCFASALNKEFTKTSVSKESLQKIFTSLPKMEEIAKMESDEEIQEKIGSDAYTILKSIILPKLPIISIPEHLKVKEVSSKYQFKVLPPSEERAEKFKELESSHYKVLCWHGSGSECWYSNIKNGLKTCSNGAIGTGIYFSTDVRFAAGYSKVSKNAYCNSIIGDINAIALCDIAKVPELSDHGWALTLTNDKACMLNCIFVDVGEVASTKFTVPSIDEINSSH